MPQNLFKIHEKEYVLPGTRACQGCGQDVFLLVDLEEILRHGFTPWRN